MKQENLYIKLYYSLKDHDVISDNKALQIFLWVLLCVRWKDGTMKCGRFWASKQLKMKPRTFHKVLTERVCNRYHLVTLKSDNKNTLITVTNWRKYQSLGDTLSDNKVTTKGQQSDTNREIRESKREKTKKTREELIKCLEDNRVETLIAKYAISKEDIIDQWERMIDYNLSNNKTYSNWNLAFHNWLKNAIKWGHIKIVKTRKQELADLGYPDVDSPEYAKARGEWDKKHENTKANST